MRMIGYVRVSTDEQADSGAGLDAQRAAITGECVRRGWQLVAVHTDAGASGKSLKGRPALAEALHAVESGQAEGVVVAKLDRLSRSLLDFAGLMACAQAGEWNLVALDLGIDLTTPAGEFMANVMTAAAQWERRIISQRTADALAAKRAQGVRLGRPRSLPDFSGRPDSCRADWCEPAGDRRRAECRRGSDCAGRRPLARVHGPGGPGLRAAQGR